MRELVKINLKFIYCLTNKMFKFNCKTKAFYFSYEKYAYYDLLSLSTKFYKYTYYEASLIDVELQNRIYEYYRLRIKKLKC